MMTMPSAPQLAVQASVKRADEILVVDDTPASLQLLADLLTEAGYVVRVAPEGAMALHSALARPPELILLDVRMPGMDGYELCRRLKAAPQTCNVPVIFLSALRETTDKLRGFTLGAVDYIGKPYQAEEVLARVRTHIDLHRLKTRLAEEVEQRTEELRLSSEELEEKRAQLQALMGFMHQVREDERTSIARELHDELGQSLTALRIELSWLRKHCAPLGEVVLERADAGYALVEQTVQSLRRISEGLRPGMLDVLGLCAALEHLVSQFAERTGVSCSFSADADDYRLPENGAITVFRLVQEALTNVARHAEASQVSVRLAQEKNSLHLCVSDNGRGFASAQPRQGFGLLGMRERVLLLGGEITIDGKNGTHIDVRLPLVKGE
ncbi:response regulator [Azonexus sp.]|uniref:ATP-binding response regulator n=1 Tax=Azonexus sp. TaxID=1872668 RepID=UPI0039E2842A